MIPCYFQGGHDNEVLSVRHYTDCSYMAKGEKGYPSTLAVFQCRRCGKIDKKIFYMLGYLTKEQAERAVNG